jgi:hypothetical protein
MKKKIFFFFFLYKKTGAEIENPFGMLLLLVLFFYENWPFKLTIFL